MDDFSFFAAVRCPPFSCQKGGDCEGRGEDRGKEGGNREKEEGKDELGGQEIIDRDPTRSQMIRLSLSPTSYGALSLYREIASRGMVQERTSYLSPSKILYGI